MISPVQIEQEKPLPSGLIRRLLKLKSRRAAVKDNITPRTEYTREEVLEMIHNVERDRIVYKQLMRDPILKEHYDGVRRILGGDGSLKPYRTSIDYLMSHLTARKAPV